MTVTLAYYDSVSDKCYIGADSCASDAINHSVCKNMKCFHPVGRRDVLIGCAGTFRLPNLLQYVPNVFPEEEDLPTEKIDMAWLVNEFTPVLGALTDDFEDDDVWELLIAVNKHIYRIQMDLSVVESADNVDAIGIGGSVALGAFKTLNDLMKDMSVTDRIKYALQVACNSCQGCQPPFVIVETEKLPDDMKFNEPDPDMPVRGYSIVRHDSNKSDDKDNKKKRGKRNKRD